MEMIELTAEGRNQINREALAHLRKDGILLDDESLALNVDKKIDAGSTVAVP